MKIKISKYYLKKCSEFADAQLKTESKKEYTRRGASDIGTVKKNIIVGKLGEIAMYQYLIKKGHELEKPDFAIYEGRKKSFGADLSTERYDIHVKSQGLRSIKRYGYSWIMQRSDKLTTNLDTDDLVAFLTVDVDNLEADIVGVVSAKDLVDFELFEECKVFSYRHSKVAIYWDTVKENLSGNRRRRL
jgi:hypothetical protein